MTEWPATLLATPFVVVGAPIPYSTKELENVVVFQVIVAVVAVTLLICMDAASMDGIVGSVGSQAL